MARGWNVDYAISPGQSSSESTDFFNSMFRFFEIPTDVRVHSAEGDVYPVDYAEFDAPNSANLKLRGATSVRKGVAHIFEMIQRGELRPTWPGEGV